MKGFIISGLAGLFIASLGATSYADTIRVNATNESGIRTNLIIGAQKRVVSLGVADATLFTAQYNYPDRIAIQTPKRYPKACDWARARPPGIRMDAIQSLDIIISTDKLTNSLNCLIDWH
jgi:hypothetical protein